MKKNRRENDIKFRLSAVMRVSMNNALKYNGSKHDKPWRKLTGYSVDQLIKHLEKQFKIGMTWDNYGKAWQIDHIIPISKFNFAKIEHEDFKRCWALENLQPLWKEDNLKKGNKIKEPFQPSLLM